MPLRSTLRLSLIHICQKTLVLQTVFQPCERVVTVLVFQTGLQAPARQFGTDKVGQRFQHACIVNAGGGICTVSYTHLVCRVEKHILTVEKLFCERA